jgi:hypothetical protein
MAATQGNVLLSFTLSVSVLGRKGGARRQLARFGVTDRDGPVLSDFPVRATLWAAIEHGTPLFVEQDGLSDVPAVVGDALARRAAALLSQNILAPTPPPASSSRACA